jgi:GrpB-like predicted nucleotidyltransferase (UPF0157 family)
MTANYKYTVEEIDALRDWLARLDGLNEDLAFVEQQLQLWHTDTVRLMWEQRREALQEKLSVLLQSPFHLSDDEKAGKQG